MKDHISHFGLSRPQNALQNIENAENYEHQCSEIPVYNKGVSSSKFTNGYLGASTKVTKSYLSIAFVTIKN